MKKFLYAVKYTSTALISVLLIIITFFTDCHKADISYEPVPKKSGLSMDGYWVWGGSVIKVDSVYHMFASRWIKDNMFPENYRENSEIIRATSIVPTGPYEFREVVIGERDSAFWDSNMAHNPTIHKIDDEYVLFYIGSDFSTRLPETGALLRRIGYAVSRDIDGPWVRSDKPLIEAESNNPAISQYNEKIMLMYRDHELRVFLTESDSYRGPFTMVNDNVWPAGRIEDFYLYRVKDRIYMICEDNAGEISGMDRWGVSLHSDDCGFTWKKSDPVVFYDHDLVYDDGDILRCTRRERPQLLIENGLITHLITAIYDGNNSWCQPVGFSKALETSNP